MSAAKVEAEKLIRENPVVVFSKSYCPYCKMTKQHFKNLGVSITAYELDQQEEDQGAAMQAALKAGLDTPEFTYEQAETHSSVPNIWIGKTHIKGGNSGFEKLLKNDPDKVQQLLQNAAAMHSQSPVESNKSPVEAGNPPVDSIKSPVESIKSPVEAGNSPVGSGKSPIESASGNVTE